MVFPDSELCCAILYCLSMEEVVLSRKVSASGAGFRFSRYDKLESKTQGVRCGVGGGSRGAGASGIVVLL